MPWLPILVAADKTPMHTLPNSTAHNHMEVKQNISISMADVGGSNSSGSVAADDLGIRQQ